jgi:acylglycerol lipase
MAETIAPRVKIIYHAAPDGAVLAARHWCSGERPRGTVVLLHGIVSHGGWYEATGQALAARGYEVFMPDRRGSGLNRFVSSAAAHWTVWRDDVLDLLRGRACGPVVLCGISWGAKLAVASAASEPDLIAGLGLLNPGLFAYQAPNALIRAGLKLSRWLPLDDRPIDIPLTDPALFTASPHWQHYIARDPLKLRQVTLGAAREDVALTAYAQRAVTPLTMPILLVLSGRDRITDNAATLAYLSRLPSRDKTVCQYPEAAHTLDFEPDPSPYHAGLKHWIDRIFSARPSVGP